MADNPLQEPFSEVFLDEVRKIWATIKPGEDVPKTPLIMLLMLEDVPAESEGFGALLKVHASEQNNNAEILIRSFKLLINQVARFLYRLVPTEESRTRADNAIASTMVSMLLREFSLHVDDQAIKDFVNSIMAPSPAQSIILTDN